MSAPPHLLPVPSSAWFGITVLSPTSEKCDPHTYGVGWKREVLPTEVPMQISQLVESEAGSSKAKASTKVGSFPDQIHHLPCNPCLFFEDLMGEGE